MPEQPTAQDEIRMLADHPALDFLNTIARIDGELVDSFESGDDILRWLDRAGWPVDEVPEGFPSSSLLDIARSLREAIRASVERRKAGKRSVNVLNSFLAEAQSHIKLVLDKEGGLRLERRWTQRTPEQVLAPVAESAAELLATGNFDLIRPCEDEECGLWFYDRTRSHLRKWCSMSRCGNRSKVTSFRNRRQDLS
jgi:predicted RNA-binding Zn ribbon-like protein